jgi:hypothetical protein
MNYAPMHYRKQPIYEDGDYSQLSIYVRGLGEMIRKFCNDQGVFALGGRSPAEAVAHKIGAHRGDRRTLAADIDTLIRSGFLRLAPNMLVVVQQEEFWTELDNTRSSRSAREPNTNRTPPTREARANRTRTEHEPNTTNTLPTHDVHAKDEASSRNHSLEVVALDHSREDKSDEINKKRPSPDGEGVQGEHDANPSQPDLGIEPQHEPEPLIRRPIVQQLPSEPNNFDAAVGRGPEAWGLDGSQAPIPEPFMLAAPPEPPKSKAKSKARPKPPIPEQKIITLSPAEQAAVDAIRKDPNLICICKNVEQLAVDLVNCAPLIDVAVEIRGLGAYLRTDKGRSKRYTDGNGYLLNNIGRKQNEQRERQASMPQYVAPVKPPPRPVPPPPPLHPMVEAGAKRAAERMARGEIPNFDKLFNVGLRTPEPIDSAANGT